MSKFIVSHDIVKVAKSLGFDVDTNTATILEKQVQQLSAIGFAVCDLKVVDNIIHYEIIAV